MERPSPLSHGRLIPIIVHKLTLTDNGSINNFVSFVKPVTNKTVSTSEIGKRLKSFGQERFGGAYGWKRQFAEALGVSPQHLERYLSGASDPGKKMFLRLIHLGCDVHWLLTGARSEGESGISSEEEKILRELRRVGINRIDQIRYLLSPDEMADDIAVAVVRELKARYSNRAKKRGEK